MNYDQFVEQKRIIVEPSGFDIRQEDLNPMLFDFQRDIVQWALRRGKAAIFADCGLGKTPMQLEWARHITEHTGAPVLILAPLAVSYQTQREGDKFGISTYVSRDGSIGSDITITNYEQLSKFKPDDFSGIVLDESSILKSFGGSLRKEITSFAQCIDYRLGASATPAPNDLIELTNHSEFLSIMTGKEIIALFFTQDGNTTHSWRLKGHARESFWKWLAIWSVAIRQPSDLGYQDQGFILPKCKIHMKTVELIDPIEVGTLFALETATLQEQRRANRASLEDRVAEAASLANNSSDAWLIWCNLNDESTALNEAIPDAVEVRGSHSQELKEERLLGFSEGRYRVLVTKPSIAGFGMNWQHCHNVVFVGLSHSYEQYYQAVRRVWRFGQENDVQVYVITSSVDGAVVKNIRRKEKQAMQMFDEVVKHMAPNSEIKQAYKMEQVVQSASQSGNNWKMFLGDSIKTIDDIETGSVGFCIFSPPFPGMYTYTNSPNDVGNCDHIDSMIEHFRFLVEPMKLGRVMMPGRLVAIHLMQLTSMKNREGVIGIKDYRGKVIQMMQDEGFIYHGEVTIDKNPQIQATRNKERGLLFKSLATDSAMMRMALADYLIYFRAPGDNPIPIKAGISNKYNPDGGWITEQEWIEWAAPVWYRQTKHYPGGIRETDVLNVKQAKETDDERHLCPLQIGVIERAIRLWSNPNELIYSPFAGIGSEGVVALREGRCFVGGELKESYYLQACRNLIEADLSRDNLTLFDFARLEATNETAVQSPDEG